MKYYEIKTDENIIVVVIRGNTEKTYILKENNKLHRFITKHYEKTSQLLHEVFKPWLWKF